MTLEEYKLSLAEFYETARDMPSLDEARFELMHEAILAILEKLS